jgi:hypothetical protein
MIHIKKFIDRVSLLESRNTKDLVMPLSEARGLRDEITKLISDLYDNNRKKDSEEKIIQIQLKGGNFK